MSGVLRARYGSTTKDYNHAVFEVITPSPSSFGHPSSSLPMQDRLRRRSPKNHDFNRSPLILYNADVKPSYKAFLKSASKANAAGQDNKKKPSKMDGTTTKRSKDTLDLESVDASSDEEKPVTHSRGYFKKISAGDKDVKDDQNRHLPSMKDEDIDEWFRCVEKAESTPIGTYEDLKNVKSEESPRHCHV
jgi:hypothetical protein